MSRHERCLKICKSLLCKGEDDQMCVHSFIWPGSHMYDTLPYTGCYTWAIGTKAWSLSCGDTKSGGVDQKINT